MFGISCAPELFQKTIEQILIGCEGYVVYIDDILIYGENEKQHDVHLEAVKNKLESFNVKLNEEKCRFKTSQIEFLGHQISEKGVKPAPSKIEAVNNFRKPDSVEEVRSFLGLVNYVSRFIPDVATKTYPLRELIKLNKYKWENDQMKSFEILKSALTSKSVLGFYSIEDQTHVVADASPVGLGAVLCQTGKDGPRVIAYGHRSLSEREQKYHITEKEAMALVWAVEHFHMYLFGKKFDLITDHKPLEFLFNSKSTPCARVERWVLRLQTYDFTVIYKPGKTNIADPLSRLPKIEQSVQELFEDSTESFINAIFEDTLSLANAITLNDIDEISKEDEEIKLVRKCIDGNELWDSEELIQQYSPFKYEFCFHENILLRGTRIVIPGRIRDRILLLGHEGHPGIENMKKSLRRKVWWPKIDSDIKNYVQKCHECNLVTVASIPEPMKTRNFPTAPWVDISIDFCGPFPSGHYLLVVIDYYSRFKEVIVMERITSKETIAQLRKVFALFGLPQTITADNGKQLISREFKAFCVENGIKLHSTPPYWPQANGLVERQNNSILKRLRISASIPNRDWQQDLQAYLLMDRNTPHPATGFSPAELFFGRPTRTKIPSIQEPIINYADDEARDNDLIAKTKMKKYADTRRHAKLSEIKIGDLVLVQKEKSNKLDTPYKDELYEVLNKHHGDVTLKSTKTNVVIRRNVAHMKKYLGEGKQLVENIPDANSSDDDLDNSSPHNEDSQARVEKPPIPKLRIQMNPIPKCTAVYHLS